MYGVFRGVPQRPLNFFVCCMGEFVRRSCPKLLPPGMLLGGESQYFICIYLKYKKAKTNEMNSQDLDADEATMAEDRIGSLPLGGRIHSLGTCVKALIQ